MRVLVTGGAGFLGPHLVDRLPAAGADVWCCGPPALRLPERAAG